MPLVPEHHEHTFKRTKPLLSGLAHDNGVLYLGDGSDGKLRVPMTPEELAFRTKSSSNYHMSLHRIEGAERYHLALDEFGRVTDVCRSGQSTSEQGATGAFRSSCRCSSLSGPFYRL